MRIARVLPVVLVVAGLAACGDPTEPAETRQSLEIVSGDGQEALVWQILPDSLRVRVTDGAGKPLSGVLIAWTATTGDISPSLDTTDASGVAAARWTFNSPVRGWSSVGTHRAAAIMVGVDSVTFTSYARAGVVLRSVSITPQSVDVTSSAAVVTVRVRATDDRTGLGLEYVSMQFFNVTNPAAGYAEQETWFAVLDRVSGTPADGVWQGTITVPQGAESGFRKLSLNLSWGCGPANRRYVYDGELRSQGMADQVNVTGLPSQPNLLPALRGGEAWLKLSASSSCS